MIMIDGYDVHSLVYIKPLSNYRLILKFDNNKVGIFDMNEEIYNKDRKIFEPLKDMELFSKAKLLDYGLDIEWTEEIGIDAMNMYYICEDLALEEFNMLNAE